MKNILTYYVYLNENIFDIDPYGEEEWNDDFDFKVGDKVITKGVIYYDYFGSFPGSKLALNDREGTIVRIKERRGDLLMIVIKFEGERHLLGTVLSPHKDCWPFFVKEIRNGYLACSNDLFIKKVDKLDEATRWYKNGKLELDDEQWEDEIIPDVIDYPAIKVGDVVEVDGNWNGKVFNKDVGEVVRIFNVHPLQNDRILKVDNGKDIDIVVKFEGRRDLLQMKNYIEKN